MRRVGAAAALCVVMAAGLTTAVSPAPPALAAGPADPLDDAREAAHRVPFTGRVEVTWRDGAQVRRYEVNVSGTDGTLTVDGPDGDVVETRDRRLVRGDGDDWQLLWSSDVRHADEPDTETKYDITSTVEDAAVAGRPVTVVEVRQRTALRARFYVDEETGLMLRRDHLDDNGEAERTYTFLAVTVGPSAPVLPLPTDASDEVPDDLGPGNSVAPRALADGYVRVGSYQRDAAAHLLYSDGLYDLSLFEQEGDLDDDPLPDHGRRVDLGRVDGLLYSWAGGHFLTWDAGDIVRTIVSDAPSGQIVAAARALPEPKRARPSLLERLRQACEALVDPVD